MAKVSLQVPEEVLKDVFSTALEGGSNYWCYIPDAEAIKVRRLVTKPMSFAEKLFECVYHKKERIAIRDAENEKQIGVLSRDTFDERLQKLMDDGNTWAITNEMAGDGDAESSDVVFQYLVMGELVYG